jgi:cell fate regulator YaaT (PSP1 superfamily)
MSENRKDIPIEDLEKFDNLERNGSGRQGRQRAASPEELPEVLYRLKTLHSCETFFGSYEASQGEWPHFRTLDELEALLEGPFASSADQGQATEPEAEPVIPEAFLPEPPAETAAEATAEAGTEPGSEYGEAVPAQAVASEPTVVKPAAVELVAPEPAAPEQTPVAEQAAPRYIPRRALVVSPTKYGRDIVEVQGKVNDKSLANADEVVAIERPAGIDDLRRLKENADKEKRAFELCRDKIWSRNLPMKLVSAHYLLDEPKILFYFAAESRVDFRELVKDLVSIFKTRIELRQIGVRDEARVTGGCGVCGRVLCCHGISDRLNPVSIKMAKDQNLSLNSLKISGPCGRLLCCLSYEFQFYRDARRELPQEGVKFIYDGTLFKVVEVNALASMVKMAGEDGRVLDMKAERFKYSEGRWKVIEDAD